jgi:hypothetical protein
MTPSVTITVLLLDASLAFGQPADNYLFPIRGVKKSVSSTVPKP